MVLKALVHVRAGLHRRQVTHELQGRVNDFLRRLRKAIPNFDPPKLKLEWIDPNEDRKAFFDRDAVVLRLRRTDPEDLNLVHGAYLFVAETLLRKAKRYVSPSQREALDLYTCGKLLEEERPVARAHYVDEYLHPKTADPKNKTGRYIDDFAVIDRAKLYFPLLLQELAFLGEKVFGRRRDATVITEVDELIQFLRPIAARKIGEVGDLTYCGR